METRDDILLAAMTQGRKEITSLISRDTDEWEWGKLHRATLRNSTLGESDIAVVERLFNRGNYGVSGGPAVVNAMAFDDREGYHVTGGPTMRMLIDLGDLDASRWVNQSGVSGMPSPGTTTIKPRSGRRAGCCHSSLRRPPWMPVPSIGYA